jgi:hypothetical protein
MLPPSRSNRFGVEVGREGERVDALRQLLVVPADHLEPGKSRAGIRAVKLDRFGHSSTCAANCGRELEVQPVPLRRRQVVALCAGLEEGEIALLLGEVLCKLRRRVDDRDETVLQRDPGRDQAVRRRRVSRGVGPVSPQLERLVVAGHLDRRRTVLRERRRHRGDLAEEGGH